MKNYLINYTLQITYYPPQWESCQNVHLTNSIATAYIEMRSPLIGNSLIPDKSQAAGYGEISFKL